ncbi:MAG: hypothetical protein CL913_02830 [Deltaproteobacteria bacterium]|nr:hypothetical protein [Deltaproteobacteria bacterium]
MEIVTSLAAVLLLKLRQCLKTACESLLISLMSVLKLLLSGGCCGQRVKLVLRNAKESFINFLQAGEQESTDCFSKTLKGSQSKQ